MKIIFSVTENKGKQSIVDARFGRAAGFFLFDEESDTGTWIDNTSNMNAAGVQEFRRDKLSSIPARMSILDLS